MEIRRKFKARCPYCNYSLDEEEMKHIIIGATLEKVEHECKKCTKTYKVFFIPFLYVEYN